MGECEMTTKYYSLVLGGKQPGGHHFLVHDELYWIRSQVTMNRVVFLMTSSNRDCRLITSGYNGHKHGAMGGQINCNLIVRFDISTRIGIIR
jgi:hypothetical protein